MTKSDATIENKNMDLNALVSQLGDMKLLERRIVMVSEGITAAVAKRTIGQFLALEAMAPGEPITVYLNSPGGEVTSGFAIYDTIRFISSPVRMVSAGLTASIATIIFIAAKREHRYSLPNSRFLIHQPLIPGQIYGQASDIEITAREILKTRQKLNELLAAECKQPLEKIAADTTRDYWMSAPEAKDYGLVTKIIENIKEIS